MFSFHTVLIRDQDASTSKYNTVWTLDLIKGLLLTTIIYLGAESVADFFNEPRVEAILYWVGIVPMIRGFTNIGTVDFQKHLDFHKTFIFNTTARFAGTLSTLLLAVALRDYWALVYGSIIRVVMQVVLSYVMSGFRPRLCLSETFRVFGFSSWVFISNISMSIYVQTPVVVIGRLFDAQALAFFNIAKEFVSLTSNQFAAQIRAALFPGISKMQNDPRRMEETVTSALGVIILFGLPATIGIGLTAPLFVPLFLGVKWIEAIPIVTVLSISAAVGILYPNSATLFLARNQPHITAAISILRFSLLVPTVLLIVPKFGALGAAWSLVCVSSLTMIVDYTILFRETSMTLRRVLSSIWRSTVAVTIMAIIVYFLVKNPSILGLHETPTLHFLATMFSGMVVYVAGVATLWKICQYPEGAEAFVMRTIRRSFSTAN